jgi:hypothetical protein
MGEEMRILSSRPCGTSSVLLHSVKSYDMGPSRFIPIREEGVLRIFIALKKYIALGGFEPATFGSSGKHTNHFTTKATCGTSTASPLKLLQILSSQVPTVQNKIYA